MATDTINRLFDDLLNLEVNLILKAEMTARKMPLTGEAFHDVANQYCRYLTTAAQRLGTSVATDAVPDERVDAGVFTGLSDDALELRQRNSELPPVEEPGDPDAMDVVLKRIQRNSEQLAGIMLRHELRLTKDEFGTWTAVELDRKEDLLILRKAWEVGVESVVMQTVAQVDGDIVTRIQPSFAGPADNGLVAVHMNMVATSLEHWRFLFATLATFTLEVFKRFFPS